MLLVLNAASATGDWFVVRAGRYTFDTVGTFGGATVKLQILGPDDATALDVGAAVSFTAAGIGHADLPAGSYRAAVVGGTGVSVTSSLRRIGD